MKSKKMTYFKYFNLFFAIAVLVLITGCSGTSPAVPIINSFFASPSAIIAGESTTLSWTVTGADSVTIDYGIGTVALTGITTVNPTTDTTYTLIATNSAGPVIATVTVTVATIETLILQPGSEGKDAFVNSDEIYPDLNVGDSAYLLAGDNGFKNRTYIQFDLNPNPLPAGAVITDARLKIYQDTMLILPGTFNGGLYRVTSNWEENEITWNNQPTSSSDTVALPTLYDTTGTWVTCHIEDFVKGWLEGSITNYGLLLKATDESSEDTGARFFSSDYVTDITKHPILEIDYYVL
jgi:hypothetical protein